MDFTNVAIPTLGLWLLDGAVVTPIAQALARGSRKTYPAHAAVPPFSSPAPAGTTVEIEIPDPSGQAQSPGAQPQAAVKTAPPPAKIYIAVSMLVLGAAGLVAGLAGWPLIGFSAKARSWPGMLSLIAASFLGFSMSGARF